AHRINDLPGMDAFGLSFEDADRKSPAKEVVADYYRQYEEHYGFRVQRPVDAVSVFNRGTELVVAVSGEGVAGGAAELVTDVVVNATGTWGSPFIPWYPGNDSFQGRHVHTTQYEDAEDFRDRSVVVVGGGTSAIGFVMELEEVASRITWVVRRPVEFQEQGELNLEDGRRAVAAQDEAARQGRALPSIVSGTGVPRTRKIQAALERGVLREREMFERVEPHGVRFADGTFVEADAIIWATGFRPELRHLAPLKLREKEGGVLVGDGA
ncbi:MAG TPA: NAD(P)-binding domain-containing protein, partial [Terrimesophilobacter sp.]|nr:NAD(P)-binding domain-containing protein [Terrimesophilobacter sp.]